MAGSRFMTGLPGQAVKEVVRWPRITGTAGRVADVGAAAAGQGGPLPRVDVAQVQLPGQQPLGGGQHGRRRPGRGEGAEQGDPGGLGVEAAGVGPQHRPGDTPEAALEDAAVAVDQEVVADVVPTAGDRVVDVVGPDQGGAL
jgi:hypothetical protein